MGQLRKQGCEEVNGENVLRLWTECSLGTEQYQSGSRSRRGHGRETEEGEIVRNWGDEN